MSVRDALAVAPDRVIYRCTSDLGIVLWSDTIPYSYQIPKRPLLMTGWLMRLELNQLGQILNWLVLNVSSTDPCLDESIQ